MKFFLASALLASAVAFSPSFVAHQRTRTFLFAARPDASDAIAEALRLSKEFGSTSTEARLAWEAVEEMDSRDQSAAYTGGVTEEECLTENSKACMEYDEKVRALGEILSEQKASIEKVKALASEIQAVKIKPGRSTKSPDSALMKKVLKEAKEAVMQHGADSTQSKLAWEIVEEVASSDNSVSMLPSLEEECLVEAIEACEAIEELNRVLSLESQTSRYSG